MDDRGKACDNTFIERLWRSLKYEEVYINKYDSVRDAEERIKRYMNFYNWERPHLHSAKFTLIWFVLREGYPSKQ